MTIEAMKLALEALEWNYNTDLDNIPACEQWANMLKKNITALRQAIEQAEQAQPIKMPVKHRGFFDLPKQRICQNPEHEPPSYLHIPPGKGYRHFCPGCGQETVFLPQGYSL